MFGAEYVERYPNMPIQHRKIISAIVNCRSGSYGTTVFCCSECGQKHFVSRSCGNRHCPQCQHHKTQQWLEKQLDKQVPGQHFMITFTVPEEIRSIIRSNQNAAYRALFKASSQALKKLAADKHFSRIIKVEDRLVYFKYKKHGSRRWRTTRLEVMEFIRRFLQHVLPMGFMKVRHYGFMNPSCSIPIQKIVKLIENRTGETLPPTKISTSPQHYCSDCGGELVRLWSIIPIPLQLE
jgi:hypothetical protein